MSQFIAEYQDKFFQQCRELKEAGQKPRFVELSSDVRMGINLGGIDSEQNQNMLWGLEIVEREDLTNHFKVLP